MKKLRIILALALAAATVLGLTSCLALDRAKEHQIKYAEGKTDEVEFRGKTYKKLPRSVYELSSYLLTRDENYRLTESDVPVLLSDEFGRPATYDKRLDVIMSLPLSEYFTTEEHFDDYSARIRDPEFTSYAVVDNEYEEDTYKLKEQKIAVLPESVCALLTGDADDGELAVADENAADAVVYNGYYVLTLYPSTADGLVINADAEVGVIEYNGKRYLKRDAGEDGYSLSRLSDKTDEALTPYYDEQSFGFVYYD